MIIYITTILAVSLTPPDSGWRSEGAMIAAELLAQVSHTSGDPLVVSLVELNPRTGAGLLLNIRRLATGSYQRETINFKQIVKIRDFKVTGRTYRINSRKIGDVNKYDIDRYLRMVDSDKQQMLQDSALPHRPCIDGILSSFTVHLSKAEQIYVEQPCGIISDYPRYKANLLTL